ncbi:response regulator transcription factor [Paenibacillus piri]|uniref:Response regulator transcription factor n=1 Tax=Paenibacillus piri TaxID=2547395 RepID=A0A4V2ZRX2_9BACL|nr:response regulator transcription factor [Paenibacillus piri]TDF90599.1 response regulator transcription factor [Paenibacillus piri]
MWKIVIIDDDPNLLEGMRESIPWEELEVEWVGEAIDGQEGLLVIDRFQPDIILTDINMPVMNGLDMIGLLRERGFKGKFIILSGYLDFEYARQALRLQVDDYLTKPITIDNLKAVLSRVTAELEKEHLKENEYNVLKDQLKLYEPLVMEEWMKSVVTGNLHHHSDRFKEINGKIEAWSGKLHLLLCVELQNSLSWEPWDKGRNLVRFAVHNVISELAAGMFSDFEYMELHSRRFAVLLHSGARDLERDHFVGLASELKQRIGDCLNHQLKLPAQAELGNVVEDWRLISESFKMMFLNEDADHYKQYTPLRSVKFYHEFADAVRNGREEEAGTIIAGYIDTLDAGLVCHEQTLQIWASELWAIIAYSLYDVGIELERIIPKFTPYEDMTGAGAYTPAALKSWLERTAAGIINNQHLSDNSKHRQMAEFIIRFVHEHYEENITLGLLADEIQISKNYLGQIFRNVTGETFNQYVTRIRMEKAKRMILEGKLYIYEIAEKVGYSNIPYFSSQFKKYIGVNPTDLMRNKE